MSFARDTQSQVIHVQARSSKSSGERWDLEDLLRQHKEPIDADTARQRWEKLSVSSRSQSTRWQMTRSLPHANFYLLFTMLALQTTIRMAFRYTSYRLMHSSARPMRTTSFGGDRPGPPRLPAHLQKEFEELQRKAATPLASSSVSSNGPAVSSNAAQNDDYTIDLRGKPKPEFEGDVNPKTGEVGGPKNDPLNYEKEWSYSGRATDF